MKTDVEVLEDFVEQFMRRAIRTRTILLPMTIGTESVRVLILQSFSASSPVILICSFRGYCTLLGGAGSRLKRVNG